jgi:LPS export ABC transporter protein LptC
VRYTALLERSIAALFVGAMLFSCVKPKPELLEQESPVAVPDEEAFDIEVLYSDSGYIRMKLNAPEIIRYASLEDPYTEYPQGLHVMFYNDSGAVTTELSGEYAIQYPNKGITEAQKNVVVINEKGEKLQTEKLIWKEQEKLIFTEEFVRITTENEQLTGYGLQANQTFSWYKIMKPAGIIDLSEDESSN